MNNFKEMMNTLESLKKILLIEKDALIHDDGGVLESIIEEKTKKLDELNLLDMNNIDINENMRKLFAEVIELQKTNQMLTEQALSYEKNIMESIAKVLSKGNTYKKNGLEKNDLSTFIDQTV
ncbi:hypothetical protein E8P77_08515 [Soehngenia saccharolytica]|nr:hypothetical protein E8P77_08515 [Soehngenia saccharolytica]